MPTPTPTPESLNAALCAGNPLARALAKLAPAPAELATPSFLFAAGRSAESRRAAFWKRLCLGQGALTGVGAAVLAVALTQPVGPAGRTTGEPPTVVAQPTNELAPVPREYTPPAVYPVEPAGFAAAPTDDLPTLAERVRWLQLRNDVLTAGLGMLPDAVAPPPRSTGIGGPHGGVFAVPLFPERPTAPPPEDDQ